MVEVVMVMERETEMVTVMEMEMVVEDAIVNQNHGQVNVKEGIHVHTMIWI